MTERNRLVEVESEVSYIKSELAGVKRDITHISNQMSEVSDAVKGLSRNVSGLGRTNWATLASWAGVLVVVLCTLGHLSIAPYDVKLEMLRDRIEQSQKLDEVKLQVLWDTVFNHSK